MKKIVFFALSVVLFTAACTKFEEETAPNFASRVAAPSIEKVADAQHNSDSSFTVKITAAADNNYYTYAIIKGEKSSLDAETLLEGGYEKSAVVLKKVVDGSEVEIPLSACYKASDKKDITVLAEGLAPNTIYTVYAVGCDNMGIVSNVEALEIKTSDKIAPTVRYNNKWNFSAANLEEKGIITLTFDDPISLSKSAMSMNAKFYASYIAANQTHVDSYGDDECDVIFKEIIPVENISASGNTVSVKVPSYIPGAAVLISFDAGVVVNGTGLPNDTQSYGGMYYYNGKPTTYGVTGRYATKSWKFTRPIIKDEEGNDVRMPADTLLYFSDWQELIATAVPEALPGADYADNYLIPVEGAAAPTITYTDSKNRQVSYPASAYGCISDTEFGVMLNEQPNYGSYVMFSIPEGSVEDLWGNANEAFDTSSADEEGNVQNGNYFFSYGYDLNELYGTYTFTGVSYYNVPFSETVIITPRKPFSDPEYEEYYSSRNVAIYGLFDHVYFNYQNYLDSWVNYEAIHYGTFNVHSGVLNVEYEYIGQAAWAAQDNWANYVIASADTESGNYDFQQPEKGVLNLLDAIWIELKGLGTVDAYMDGAVLKKVSDDYALPGEATPAGVIASKTTVTPSIRRF